MKLLLLFFLTKILFSEEVINLQFQNDLISLKKQKSKLEKNNFYNPYIFKNRKFDSRFLNESIKDKGIEVTKKIIHLEKNQKLKFLISEKLNHKLEIKEFSKNLFSNELDYSKLKILLNGKENSSNELQSNIEQNKIEIIAETEIKLESLKLVPKKIKTQTDILFIVIDSLRADVTGFNGAKFNATPNLDIFSKSATNYKTHFVNSSWTRPSTFIFFTGLYASKHFLNFWDYPVFKNEIQSFYKSKISLLPEVLSKNGYNTFMIGNNPFLTEHRGIGADAGFEVYFDFSYFEKDTLRISTKAKEFYDGLKKNRSPYFLFLNFNDPHKPYTPTTEFLNKIQNADQVDLRKKEYLGEVRFVDEEIGKILEILKQKNLFENTLILISSDHGEVMNPAHAKSIFNGVYTLFGHGQGLYDEDIHSPLLIKYPNQKKEISISKLTRSIDLFPTILEETNIEIPDKLDGIALQKIEKEKENRIYYGESRGVIGIRDQNYKWQQKVFGFSREGKHWNGIVSDEPSFLFDIKKDKEETSSINDQNKKKYYYNLAHQFWKKNSIFTTRIKNDDKEKEIYFESFTNLGKIRLTDKTGQPIENKEFLESQKGFVFEKKLKPFELVEFHYISYPDIEFPKFKIYSDEKEISKKNFGAGEKDIYPFQCQNPKDCQKLFLAKNHIPEIPKKNEFRVQIWYNTNKNEFSSSKNELGQEAIDILKKQGYIQ